MRVLIIESDSESARLLQRGLEAEYYAVDVASDGDSGIRFAESDEYDLITLNNNIPGIDGCEFVKNLRLNKILSPIIIISETKNTKVKTALLNCGCDDYIVKPFHFEELAARIRAILRRKGFVKKELLEIGGLFLDSIGHEVKFKGKSIDLRNREFALLEYLMRNEGRVVTRNMVLEHVWDINADSFSNTIEVHITHLRRKLGEASSMIKTVRGVGYKLITPS